MTCLLIAYGAACFGATVGFVVGHAFGRHKGREQLASELYHHTVRSLGQPAADALARSLKGEHQ